MLTRKHYVSIAHDIRMEVQAAEDRSSHHPSRSDWSTGYDVSAMLTLENVANRLADTFKADNPRFDRQKFLTACGF